jgi:(S)-2-hydroxyglutarate dehydrogenase
VPGNAPSECEIAVVGGGIVGLAVARELLDRRPERSLVVLEREEQIGRHQTGHTSGVIHAGIYYRPGSLKARLCVEGARLLYEYCDRKGIEARRDGKLIVAGTDEELEALDELEHRGRANSVPGLRRLGTDQIAEIEPRARGVAALHSPETGVTDFVEVAHSYAADAEAGGGTVATGCAVSGSRAEARRIVLEHGQGATAARFAVFCAGPWADRLAVEAGAPAEPRIVPFRGGYLKLRRERRDLVRASIYPVPNPRLPFLGAHLTRGIDGEVLLGPSALLVGARDGYRLSRLRPADLAASLGWPGTWRLMSRHWRTGLAEMRRAASRRAFVSDLRRFVPELSHRDVVPAFAGVRAQALARDGELLDDFLVSHTERALHVRNAPSPAATSSLALARLIADEAEREIG